MGYLHIENLYKCQDILLFKECYALEKIHGTSAHVGWKNGSLTFFSGGESYDRFVSLFDRERLAGALNALGHAKMVIYGEAYGGKQQGMSAVYGKELRFVVFDVQIGECWLSVPDMADVAKACGFDVVPFERVSTDLPALDAQRDRPSVQAERNGCGAHPREGVVLRPLIEVTKNNGARIIAKHKIEKFSERSTPQKIVDPAKLLVLTAVEEIAKEWVTPMRLAHVVDKLPAPHTLAQVPVLIEAMVEDVLREASGEIVDSKDMRRAISRRAVELFRQLVTEVKELT